MDDVDLLMQTLQETIALLREYKIDFWADWLERDYARIKARDFYGVKHLLTAFGGMGSFVDLMSDPANGLPISIAEVEPLARRLRKLMELTYALAPNLRREMERPEV